MQRVVTDLAGPVSNAALGLIALMADGLLMRSGVLGVYLALFNLLPLPALNGFDLIVAVTPSLRSRRPDFIQVGYWLSLLAALGSQTGFIYVALAHPEMPVSI